MLKIILLSDLHIADNGVEIWNTDTLSHFISAKHIIENDSDADAIIICGDIADDGSLWAYKLVTSELDQLKVPVYYVPGNHDSIDNMSAIVNPESFLKSFVIDDWKFILLNSVMPNPETPLKNMARGMLDTSTIYRLKVELDTDYNICVVMHHPPIEQEGWLNRKLLDKDDFNSIIAEHQNVKLVFYGHTHFHSIREIGHTKFICVPSIGFAFDKDLPKFQIDNGKEGFLKLILNGDDIDCTKFLIK